MTLNDWSFSEAEVDSLWNPVHDGARLIVGNGVKMLDLDKKAAISGIPYSTARRTFGCASEYPVVMDQSH